MGSGTSKLTNQSAIILCGGKSSRFGQDKAGARLDGRSLLERLIECAGARADEVILACGASARYEEFGLKLAIDAPGMEGPLAGMRAGIARTHRPLVYFLAVDMVHATPAAMDRLRDAIDGGPPVDLVMPRTTRGLEPLFSLGRREAVARAIETLVHCGDSAPRGLAEILSARFLDVPENPTDPLRRAITNINTPQDLAALAG